MNWVPWLIFAAYISSLEATLLRPSAPVHSAKMADGKFEQRREAVLDAISCGADRSKKGSFDAPIADMLCHLNGSPDFVSTSSCSGRVALFWESTVSEGATEADLVNEAADSDTASVLGAKRRAKGGQWLLCKHGEVTVLEVEAALAQASTEPGIVFFKHEPFVLHVQCRSVEAACQLMEVARTAGYRESGISIGKKHIIVGVRTSALKIDAPVHENGQLLVSKEYLQVLVRLANEKFAKNRDRTDRLYSVLKQTLLKDVVNPEDPTPPSPSPDTPDLTSLQPAGPWAVTCAAKECEHVRGLLVRSGWLDKTHRNLKLDNGRMAIPVTAAGAGTLLAQSGSSAPQAQAQTDDRGAAERKELGEGVQTQTLTVEVVAGLEPAGRTSKPSPATRLAEAMTSLLKSRAADLTDNVHAEALRGVPKKWEEYGDLVLLPEGSLQGAVWASLDQLEVWGTAAKALGAQRVAIKAEVDEGAMRESHIRIAYPEGASGWVSVVQHGLTYQFDMTRVMFSRGNVNERRRMGQVDAKGQTVVDLFAGIGYFTVPLLATGGAKELFACEWNPASVEALRRNLEVNLVADRCTVLEGDNQLAGPALEGKADRVLLGLLPSSEGAWELAVRCLKPLGGWLHVHENVGEADMEGWKKKLQQQLLAHSKTAGRKWDVAIKHVEFVKTYAPRVWHVVVDVECTAAAQ